MHFSDMQFIVYFYEGEFFKHFSFREQTIPFLNVFFLRNQQIEGSDFYQYFNMSAYLILTLLDVFQLCYFGDTLKQQSSHIDDALLRCPWYLCGGPFRRLMSVILANSRKSLVLTGGKFFVLDLNKLASVRMHAARVFMQFSHD